MEFLYTLWEICTEAAPYLLLGLCFAGIIKTFLSESFIQKHLGKDDTKSVVKAALFGIPLPLCSCGVVPTAVSLRNQGASKGATTSFLISTPESGVDSIAISYALLDPLMTVIRPVAGFLTAITAGLFENKSNNKVAKELNEIEPSCSTESEIIEKSESCCSTEPIENSSCCDDDLLEHNHQSELLQVGGRTKTITETNLDKTKTSCCSNEVNTKKKPSLLKRLQDGLKYSFVNLMADISYMLAIGLIMAATITYFVPDRFFEMYLSNSVVSMFVMLIVGIPMYICATASTPIAAALILKGISPGAAIVFLIAGPATNMASITVLQKMLGKASIIRYLAVIVVCSLLIGFATDFIYFYWEIPIAMMSASESHSFLHTTGLDFWLTVMFLILLFYGIWKDKLAARFAR